MASMAAVLQVGVDAKTEGAVRELRKFDSMLRRTDRTSVSATTRTTALGKASNRAGGALRSAARYATGAAAAYLSISQAKAAVTTTQDLAKTTAGLNRNLGLSVKEGSRWAAVAKSRDIDAKALTMSFTVLSRRVVEAAHAIREGGGAAETAMVPFTRLGISQEEVVKGSKNLGAFLPRLADAFGDAAGGAKRQASAQQLLGRGYATIVPLFAQGAEGLKEQQMWADKYGTTLNQKTLKAQMDLVQAQRESKVAWVGLQMTFAQAVTPALQEANKEFQRIAAIMGSDKLTRTEKLEKVGKIIGGWAEKAFDVFIKVLPQMVAKAGEAAPRIAGAFVKGFLDAPIWGKVAIGALLFGKFGGRGGILSAAGSLGAKVAPLIASPIGLAIAGEIAAAIAGAKVGEKLDIGQTDVTSKIAEELDITLKKAKRVQEYMAAHPGLGAPESLEAMRNATKKTSESFKTFGDVAAHTSTGVGNDAKRASDKHNAALGTMRDKQGDTGRSAEQFGNKSAGSFDKVGDKSGSMKDKVSTNVQVLQTAIAKGLQNIGRNTNKALNAFGVKPVNFGIEAPSSAEVEALHQTGGVIVPGQGNGDKVPALLEPGEVVWNKKAVAAMGGAQKANSVNKKIRRFAKGGVVPGDTGGLHPGILNFVSQLYQRFGGSVSSGLRAADSGSLHSTGQAADYVPNDWAGASRAVNAVGSKLLEGIYNPGMFGGSPVSWDTGQNVPPSFWAEEWGNHLDHIHLAISDSAKGLAVKAVKEIKRVMLKGPDGPLKDMGQAALDKVRAAANKFIASKAPTMTGDATGATGAFPSGPGKVVTASWYGPTPATVGGAGVSLPGTMSFAELSNPPGSLNYSALGGLPYHSKIGVEYRGKKIVVEKLDVGAGGPGINGHIRAIDLWEDAAKQLPGAISAGLFDVKVTGAKAGGIIPKLAKGSVAKVLGFTPDPTNADEMALADAFATGKVNAFAEGGILGKMITEASRINSLHSNYVYGGGHVTPAPAHPPWDCSSAVSRILQVAGYDIPTMVSGDLAHWGKSGTGPATIFANAEHTFMKLGGRYWGTSREFNKGGGPGWIPRDAYSDSYLSAFAKRVPPGKVTTGGDGGNSSSSNESSSQNGDGKGDKKDSGATNIGTIDATAPGVVKSLEYFSPKNMRERKRIKELLDKLKGLTGSRTTLDAQISDAETAHTFMSSEAGAELGSGERAEQIALNTGLLENLKSTRDVIRKLLRNFSDSMKKPMRDTLFSDLVEIEEVTGNGGAILAVKQKLDELTHPDSSLVSEPDYQALYELQREISTNNLRRFLVSQAQYQVLAGAMAKGGNVVRSGAYLVGEDGPEIVGLNHGQQVYSSRESSQMLGGATVVINGDIVNTPPGKQPVEVQGAKAIVKQGSRGMGKRVLPGHRGY